MSTFHLSSTATRISPYNNGTNSRSAPNPDLYGARLEQHTLLSLPKRLSRTVANDAKNKATGLGSWTVRGSALATQQGGTIIMDHVKRSTKKKCAAKPMATLLVPYYKKRVSGRHWATVIRDMHFTFWFSDCLTASRKIWRKHVIMRRYGPLVSSKHWILGYEGLCSAMVSQNQHRSDLLWGVGLSLWDVYRIIGLPIVGACMMDSSSKIKSLQIRDFPNPYEIFSKFGDICIVESPT